MHGAGDAVGRQAGAAADGWGASQCAALLCVKLSYSLTSMRFLTLCLARLAFSIN